MKNIVFIAPPAAGKGTQSKMICSAYGVPHISTGDLLRKATSSGTTLGNYIKVQMDLGNLIDDETMLELIEERIKQKDCENGYVLDGYPRNVAQAKAYDTLLASLHKKVEQVLVLDLPYELAKKRITGRISCPKCGGIFNDELEALKPEKTGVCDFCKGKLIKRKDDTEEVFKHRFALYETETKPLLAYYEGNNLLVHIDSNRDAYLIFKDIRSILGEPRHD